MLLEKIKSREFFSFISHNLGSNPNDLLIKYSGKDLEFDIKFAVVQIANRKKTGKKIPCFLKKADFLFPDMVSSEQASDERVARFHASLIGDCKNVVDLTAGLGIDAMTIALHGNHVTAIEIDDMKAEVLEYNAKKLSLSNFYVINSDCEKFLADTDLNNIDIFFIDPARRDNFQNRTYAFSDCKPDVTLFYDHIVNYGSTLFIKASPLLDVEAVKKQLSNINHIYAVSVKGECKELLIEIKENKNEKIKITAVDLDDNGIKSKFSINGEDDKADIIIAAEEDINVGKYLYEPNASLMKINAAGEICRKFKDMKKISKNTELFISDILQPEFPGRIIKIERILSSHCLKRLKGEKRSVAVRNYPIKAEQLKKKIGVGEDPEIFIYGFRAGEKEKPLLIEGKKIEV